MSKVNILREGEEKVSSPWTYPLARVLVLNRIKARMGLDECRVFAYSAAPINK